MDKKTVEKVARLIRLELSEAEKEQYGHDLQGILKWVECLNQVDTDNVTPLYNVNDSAIPMRDDVINDGNIVDHVLQNAPEAMNGYYVVPKVVE